MTCPEQWNSLCEMEAAASGGAAICISIEAGPAPRAPRRQEMQRLGGYLALLLASRAGASLYTVRIGERETPFAFEIFLLVADVAAAAAVIRDAMAECHPVLPVRWIGRRDCEGRQWVCLSTPGRVCLLSSDGPTLEDIDKELANMEERRTRFAALDAHLIRLKAHLGQVEEEAGIALRAPESAAAAVAWNAEQGEAVAAEYASLMEQNRRVSAALDAIKPAYE